MPKYSEDKVFNHLRPLFGKMMKGIVNAAFAAVTAVAVCAPSAFAGDAVDEALARKLATYDTQNMGDHLQVLAANRVVAADRAADEAWAALKTPEEIAAYRTKLRDGMVAAIGGFPEKTPLNARTLATFARDGYTIENVVFESRPGVFVTAQFFMPEGASASHRVPGVLVSCGHSGNGKAFPCYQRAAVVFAKGGFATLIYDPVDQGERQQLPGTKVMSVGGHVNAGLRAHLIGWNEAQFRIWDGIRAMDLLASRPEVDAKKIGVTGMSGGGTLSAYLNAVDWRFAAACPSGYLTSLADLCERWGPQDCEQIIHGQLTLGLNHLSLMLMNGGSAFCPGFTWSDAFPFSGSMDSFLKAREFRKREGKGDSIDCFDCPGPHHWYESQKHAQVAWFRRHLMGEKAAWPADRAKLLRLDIGFSYDKADCGLAWKPECEVLSGKGVMSLPGARSVYDLMADELLRIEKVRRPVTPEIVRETAGISADAAAAAVECAAERIESDGITVHFAVMDMPDMVRVPVTAFFPEEKKGAPVMIAGDAASRTAYAAKVRELLAAGRAVAVAEMRGFGETGWTGRHMYWAKKGTDQEVAADLSWLGENLVARRAEDLLAAAGWFAKLCGGAKCEIRAEGRAVVAAAHAYFVGREMFASFAAERAPKSWTETMKDTSFEPKFSDLVFGGLKAYDWTDLVK